MGKYETIDQFKKERDRLNEIVMKYAGMETKRFFSLDSQVYGEGVLPIKYKEMMGLVASMVLRCEGCIKYHVIRCFAEKVSDEELEEALSISLVVAGSITIPHLRRAYDAWEELKTKKNEKK